MVELGNGALFPHKIGRNCNYSLIKLARNLVFRPEKCNFAAIIRPEKCSNTLIIRPEKCNFADIIRQNMKRSLESLKLEFIQEVLSEQSFDALQEWLDMHEEARYAASVTSNEPELIEFNRKYKESIKEGLMKSRK